MPWGVWEAGTATLDGEADEPDAEFGVFILGVRCSGTGHTKKKHAMKLFSHHLFFLEQNPAQRGPVISRLTVKIC